MFRFQSNGGVVSLTSYYIPLTFVRHMDHGKAIKNFERVILLCLFMLLYESLNELIKYVFGSLVTCFQVREKNE